MASGLSAHPNQEAEGQKTEGQNKKAMADRHGPSRNAAAGQQARR
jgi:hypothetical protein